MDAVFSKLACVGITCYGHVQKQLGFSQLTPCCVLFLSIQTAGFIDLPFLVLEPSLAVLFGEQEGAPQSLVDLLVLSEPVYNLLTASKNTN